MATSNMCGLHKSEVSIGDTLGAIQIWSSFNASGSMKVSGRRRRNPVNQVLAQAVELCEIRQLLSATYASIDGVGNNVETPHLGSVNIELLRIADPQYADGVSTPAGPNRPDARFVSNQVIAQDASILNNRNLTDFIWMWGQFVDHDIDLSNAADPEEIIHLPIPTGDIYFDPQGTGTASIDMARSQYVIGDNSSDGLRQQLNAITAFIDGSVVYGSDNVRANELRTFQGGHMKTSVGNLLPFNEAGLPNAGGTANSLFLAGDVRANENIALSSMQTLWVREHNRVVDTIFAECGTFSDEELYQQARAIVAAEIQAITYNEFLPALLGASAIAPYSGYNSSVDPGIMNEFSTAAYRFGHSLLSPELARIGPDGQPIAQGPIPLKDAFFNPSAVIATGIEPLLRGASTQLAQELDVHVVDAVRNFLFGQPGQGGLDLTSLNIERGRDHGLADYNSTRVALGLPEITSFSQITSDPAVAATLQATYNTVNNIDLWVAGIAEDHLPGSSMGATFSRILVDQFQRLRDGDRFWYENSFSGGLLQELRNTHLSDVIARNTNIQNLQANVFFMPVPQTVDLRLADYGTRKATVFAVDGFIQVVDGVNQRVIFKQPASSLTGLVVYGNALLADRLTVDGSVTAQMLPSGIKFLAGYAGEDVLIVRGTSGDDQISVNDRNASLNGLDVYFENIDQLTLEGLNGNDVLTVNRPRANKVALDGGDGNDRLTGSLGVDRLFGGPGNDVLFGDDGNDELYGGDGNDQLLGGGGTDLLIGGAGFDLLIQDGGTDGPASSRYAAFLDRLYNLSITANDFKNWGGRNERWFFSNVGWMIITPDGNIYRWDNKPGAHGSLIATVDVSCYVDLASLCNHSTQIEGEDPTTSALGQLYNFTTTANDFKNWGGRNERWFFSNVGWMFITPDGNIYRWDNKSGANGSLIATVDVSCYLNLNRFCIHSTQFADEDSATSMSNLARTMDRAMQLRSAGNLSLNWGGRNEKWIPGQQGWYFVTPDGRLYKWDGLSGADGELMGELDSNYYTRPELLYSAG
ncbi:MAG TPA: peroxidase family protein [Planctomycetaceae bacterium]|nr:peroxidase family protein [Planctomycetaceae bacterium]